MLAGAAQKTLKPLMLACCELQHQLIMVLSSSPVCHLMPGARVSCWGAGVATSLKILFDSSNCGADGLEADSGFRLERNEVIALFNLLERLSTSIEVVRSMSLQLLNGDADSELGAIQEVADTHPLFSQMFSQQ